MEQQHTGLFQAKIPLSRREYHEASRDIEQWIRQQLRRELAFALTDAISDGRAYTVIMPPILIRSGLDILERFGTYEGAVVVLLQDGLQAAVGEHVETKWLPFSRYSTDTRVPLFDTDKEQSVEWNFRFLSFAMPGLDPPRVDCWQRTA